MHGFHYYVLPLEEDLFSRLSVSADFEDVGNGRKGIHLVKEGEEGIPIVRTTTKYSKPANSFSQLHLRIAECIRNEALQFPGIEAEALRFNNALIEIYDPGYSKMKYHSDQALDLEAESYIALFSCYRQSGNLPVSALRKLKIKSKTSGEEFEFTLENNSVILFSASTNAGYQHSIILESLRGSKPPDPDNRWLGITFRVSATYIHFRDHLPFFIDGAPLTLADEDQARAFYTLRAQENESVDFTYPVIPFTISLSDTLLPLR